MLLSEDWSFVFPGAVVDVAAAPDRFFVLCDNRIIYAMDDQGNTLWQKSVLNRPKGQIHYNQAGFLIIPFANGNLYGLSAAGQELFELRNMDADNIFMLPKGLVLLNSSAKGSSIINQFGKLISSLPALHRNAQISRVYNDGSIFYDETKVYNIFARQAVAMEEIPTPEQGDIAWNKDYRLYISGQQIVLLNLNTNTKSFIPLRYNTVAVSPGDGSILIAYDNWLLEKREFPQLRGAVLYTSRGNRSNGNVFKLINYQPPRLDDTRAFQFLMNMARSTDEDVKEELLGILENKLEQGEMASVLPYLETVLGHLVTEAIASPSPNVADISINMPEIRKRAFNFAKELGYGITSNDFRAIILYESDGMVLWYAALAAASVLPAEDCYLLYQELLKRLPQDEAALAGIFQGSLYIRQTRGFVRDFILEKATEVITNNYSSRLKDIAQSLLKM